MTVAQRSEALTTGWDLAVPVEDTLLRRYLFHNGEVCTTFARAAGGHTLETPDFVGSDLGRPSGYWNAATLLRPPVDWNETVAAVEAFFAGGTGEALLWSAWPTPDLRARGWRLSGHPPFLVRPPARDIPPPAGRSDAVHEIRSRSQLATWERVAVAGYPLPELADAPAGALAGAGLLDDPRLRLWTAELNGQPVSSAASFVSHGIGSFAFGATLPAARRRGLWRQLALARLRATPDLWMTGVFSDFSRPGAEALGFVPVVRLTLWVLARPAPTPSATTQPATTRRETPR